MNKRVYGKKLSRSRPAREALFASLISSLIIRGKITTTKAKVQAIKGQIGKYLSLAKKGTLDGRRRVLADLDNSKEPVKVLFSKKFKHLKIINLPARKGDNASMARIELVEEETKNENLPTKSKRS
ncbi:MAG: bL17 family ribosomal protein [Patescibacteria group bacterium]